LITDGGRSEKSVIRLDYIGLEMYREWKKFPRVLYMNLESTKLRVRQTDSKMK
jgi:hypothetical protein